MLVQDIQTIPPTSSQCCALRAESDPTHLSTRLRELALMAYQAIRSAGSTRSGDGGAASGILADSPSRDDWTDLRTQLNELERAFDAQHLSLLASYVRALRQQVERHL
jgi:hypothetical protein